VRTIRHLIFVLISAVLAGSAWGSLLDDVGFTALSKNAHPPTAEGSGITVGQVEAFNGGGYAPDQLNSEFAGKNFTLHGITATPVSWHATMVGSRIYGDTQGLAPNVTDIQVFSDSSFTGPDGLNALGTGDPNSLGVSVLNNSWVGAASSPAQNRDILRRLDFLINRDNMVAVVAVDNGATSTYPILMASGYNSIAVGITAGSSKGPTYYDGGPRAKPDLIVPAATTSEAAAAVSGAAAMLLSEAKTRKLPVTATSIKAMLMAGAQHLAGWHHGSTITTDDLMVPLDYAQGAGQLRIDRAYTILTAGRRAAYTAVPRRGWDTNSASRTRSPTYQINLTSAVRSFVAVLTWNRRFVASTIAFTQRTQILANLSLYLQQKVGKTWRNIDRSLSTRDNVEEIYRPSLSAGTYRLMVTGDMSEYYSLAWDSDLASSKALPATPGRIATAGSYGGAYARAVPEPSTLLLALPAALLLLRRKRV
jgi:hypothetical protein